MRASIAAVAMAVAVLCSAATAQDEVSQPLVATHYFYWYAHPDEHFGGAGREGHFHSFVDPEHVSYADPAWHRREFLDMVSAGIDVALPVYWGFPGCEDRPNVRFSVLGLGPMVDALDAMVEAGEPRPSLGLFYDTSTLRNSVRGIEPQQARADLTSDAGRELFHDTVTGFFERIPKRHWGRHHGRPLVVLYTSGFAEARDATLCEGLRLAFADRFERERPFVVADASWGEVGQDATTQWGAALGGPRIYGKVAQIGPGYDDSPVPGRRTPFRPREDGAFYRSSWRAAIQARPELVLVETWNEMHEGTEVCRTVETGDRYLRLTRAGVERLRRGEPGPEVPLRFHQPCPRPDLSWGEDAKGLEAVSWQPGSQRGLRPIAWADGPIEVGDSGVRARCEAGRPVTYVYFRVSDHWRFDDDVDLLLTLRADFAGGRIVVEYDSRDRAATLAGAYTPARVVSGSSPGFGEMQPGEHLEFPLPRARLANRQNGGADFRLVLPQGEHRIYAATLLVQRR